MTEEQRRAYIAKRAKHARSESRTKKIQERWKNGTPKKKMVKTSKRGFKQTSSRGRGRRR